MINKKLLTIITSIYMISNSVLVVQAQAANSKTLAGQDRFYTSAAIAQEYKNNENIDSVILAFGNNFPDALSGSMLSQKYKAPILLCGSTIKESDAALNFIKSNLAASKTVYILGGTGSISSDVENELKSYGYTIKRIGGTDRFDTNVKVVSEFNAKEGTPVVIANGDNFPDALSISSAAASKGYPLLLTSTDTFTESFKEKLQQIKPSKLYIAGGLAAVSEENRNSMKNLLGLSDGDIIRLGGKDRYETSLKISDFFKLNSDTAVIANGESFPDALSGSSLAAFKSSPIILVNNQDVSMQKDFLHNSNYSNLIFLGGEGAINSDIKNLLAANSPDSSSNTLSLDLNPVVLHSSNLSIKPDSRVSQNLVGTAWSEYNLENNTVKNPYFNETNGDKLSKTSILFKDIEQKITGCTPLQFFTENGELKILKQSTGSESPIISYSKFLSSSNGGDLAAKQAYEILNGFINSPFGNSPKISLDTNGYIPDSSYADNCIGSSINVITDTLNTDTNVTTKDTLNYSVVFLRDDLKSKMKRDFVNAFPNCDTFIWLYNLTNLSGGHTPVIDTYGYVPNDKLDSGKLSNLKTTLYSTFGKDNADKIYDFVMDTITDVDFREKALARGADRPFELHLDGLTVYFDGIDFVLGFSYN